MIEGMTNVVIPSYVRRLNKDFLFSLCYGGVDATP